jgi:uncharacterized protein (TIGR00251 family)
MIRVLEHADGCILPVHAQPGARKAGILGEYAGSLKVAVTVPAVDGRANKSLVALLAKKLGVKRAQVILVSGQRSREKRFLIQGLTKVEVENRIARLAGSQDPT